MSRSNIAIFWSSKHLLISWLQSPSALVLEPKKMKPHIVSTPSPSMCHGVIGLDAMILVFGMLSIKPAFSLSSWTPWTVGNKYSKYALGFPVGSDGKEPACSEGGLGLIPGLGRAPGGGRGSQLQCSCLENPHGQRSLAHCSPRSHKVLDTTERLTHTHNINLTS